MSERETPKEFLGAKEAAEVYRVNVPNFIRDWASRPDFPAPAAIVANGRIWRRAEVEDYRASSGPKRGAKKQKLRLSQQAIEWLPLIKRRIVRGFKPEKIILFGSQARGEARPDSDADLLIVVSGTQRGRDIEVAIYQALQGIPLSTDVIVATPEQLARGANLAGSTLRPALREGVTIYARS